MNCGYEGAHFGAHYPDAQCSDGYLWDLDSYEDGFLHSGGDIPCPSCNTRDYVEWRDVRLSGNAKQRRTQMRKHIKMVKTWAK